MKIRLYQNTDSEELAKLFFQTVRKVNIQDYSQDQVMAWAPENRDLEKWRNSFEEKTVFVAEEDNKIIGFGELELNGHIDRFYIDADWIGKGVGKTIYEAIERSAREQKNIRLFLEASITAKPFFLKMGFTILEEQTVNVRGISMNNFVMEKTLSLNH